MFLVMIRRVNLLILYKEALRIAQTAILAVVLALRKLTLSLILSLILTVCIVVIWHENIVLYYTDVYTYINIKWEKICIHIQVANLGIYIYVYIHTNAYILFMCVCVYINVICIPARCPRSRASRKESSFRFSCCAFSGTLTSLTKIIFRSSDPKWRIRYSKTRNEKGKTSKRDQFKISFLMLQQSRLRLLTDNQD